MSYAPGAPALRLVKQTHTQKVWQLIRARGWTERHPLVNEWRRCTEAFGPEARATLGALRGLVCEAWGDPYLVPVVDTGWSYGVGRWPTERAALEAALGAAP
jgi:hypothetical protein